jgi:hypothetical protein
LLGEGVRRDDCVFSSTVQRVFPPVQVWKGSGAGVARRFRVGQVQCKDGEGQISRQRAEGKIVKKPQTKGSTQGLGAQVVDRVPVLLGVSAATVALYNATPQQALGGESPHDLVYESRGTRASTVQVEELQRSPSDSGCEAPSHCASSREDCSERTDSSVRSPYNGSLSFMTGAADEVMEGPSTRCLAATILPRVIFYVDSGAGQCLCSVSTAFSDLQPCRIEVTGVSGSLPIYGCGTANFVALDHNGRQLVVRIPNCLYERCEFNFLSVSQFNQVAGNRVDFSLDSPAVVLVSSAGVPRSSARVPLALEDGLFALQLEPLGEWDPRFESLSKYVITRKGKFVPSNSGPDLRWKTSVLAMATSSGRLLAATTEDCHDNLETFCDQYLAPPYIPPARRLYDVKSQDDMTQLSIRFLGASTDRLIRTVKISNGLKSPASKKALRVPPLIFPQGRLKTGKSPKVSKGKVGHLNQAGIGEAVFSDKFASEDSRRKYCQVFYDCVSRFGYVVAMRSKTEIGDAFADFCCQCWVPLILVRDNAGENVGGSLVEELRSRNVQSAFICPYRSQQNFAESYIGRITVMASFGMVFSGAPLFMWVHAIKAAAFINNITATFYSKAGVWATPYELVHGERFPDDEQAKFQSRCVLMLFMHCADQHPLFTYAFYSPKTKRVVFRQDCIFLPTVFPMRHARSQAGQDSDGEQLVTYHSPDIMRDGPSVVSFLDWTEADPLPAFDDDVSGFELYSSGCFPEEVRLSRPDDHPGQCPTHPEFASSFVHVPMPAAPTGSGVSVSSIPSPGPVVPEPPPRRSCARTGSGLGCCARLGRTQERQTTMVLRAGFTACASSRFFVYTHSCPRVSFRNCR